MSEEIRELLENNAAGLEAIKSHTLVSAARADLLCQMFSEFFAYQINQSNEYPSTYSSSNEDALLVNLFAKIGHTVKCFVEVGVSSLQNNTGIFLAAGASGLWLDAGLDEAELKEHWPRQVAAGKLKWDSTFLNLEHINSLISGHFQNSGWTEADLLSVDVDYNTYHIWEAIECINPKAVIVEYNASIHPSVEYVVEYDPEAAWDGSIKFGASLKSLELLGRKKGYQLVQCDISGANALFVQADLAGVFESDGRAETHYMPPRYYLSGRRGHAAAAL